MREVTNECVKCGLPCLGESCPNRRVERIYCDDCGDEADEMYRYDGAELCRKCLCERLFDECDTKVRIR